MTDPQVAQLQAQLQAALDSRKAGMALLAQVQTQLAQAQTQITQLQAQPALLQASNQKLKQALEILQANPAWLSYPARQIIDAALAP
jgi:chromosome segregation ATPase